jgi:IS1 family transposase
MGLCKKKKCSPKEAIERGYGDTWIWTALDSTSRLLICYLIGERTLDDGRTFLRDLKKRLVENPVFTSDELPHYEHVLLEMYHTIVEPEPTGWPGRPQKPFKKIHPDIDYATVHKTRVNGRIVKVDTKVVFGKRKRIIQRLATTPSNTINTAFVERSNTDWRLWDAHLCRKSLTFAKSLRWLAAKFAIAVSVYNFVRPHESLSRDQFTRKFIPKTPAMAAGITNRPWSFSELLSLPMLCQP